MDHPIASPTQQPRKYLPDELAKRAESVTRKDIDNFVKDAVKALTLNLGKQYASVFPANILCALNGWKEYSPWPHLEKGKWSERDLGPGLGSIGGSVPVVVDAEKIELDWRRMIEVVGPQAKDEPGLENLIVEAATLARRASRGGNNWNRGDLFMPLIKAAVKWVKQWEFSKACENLERDGRLRILDPQATPDTLRYGRSCVSFLEFLPAWSAPPKALGAPTVYGWESELSPALVSLARSCLALGFKPLKMKAIREKMQEIEGRVEQRHPSSILEDGKKNGYGPAIDRWFTKHKKGFLELHKEPQGNPILPRVVRV